MESASLVDLGSNSARLVVYEFERDRGFWLVDEIREVVRLGSGVARTGALAPEAIERALVALRTFADYGDATGRPPIRIMATSAVRSASNRDEFLDKVRALGLEIEVLDGAREAEQGVIAVANSTPERDAWVMDLGGGSMQLSLMRDRQYASGRAHPFGAIRATEKFLGGDPSPRAAVRALEDAVETDLVDVLDEVRASGLPLIAMGGTVRNLARAVQRRANYPWTQMHGYRLSTVDLHDLTERLALMTAAQRSAVSGINSYRGDIILAGAVVIRAILRAAGLTELTISGYGMREGALFQEFLPAPHLLDDVRAFHVSNMLWRYPQPEDHTARVVTLSARLFEELQPLHGLDATDAELLGAAARLHDIGKAIHFRDHAKHGAYLLTSAPLPGFDHREQALLSLLLRHHRSGKPSRAPYRPLLKRSDSHRLAVLETCLRLAEYLERSRTGRVRDVRARIGPTVVDLELVADGDPWVEFWETQKQAPLFESAMGRQLRLEIVAT
ncbi:MAG: HD domain-containing protein [Acidobacteria bacterium]|nr:HD domain-containing protein [Acidobacteriota bacterium]